MLLGLILLSLAILAVTLWWLRRPPAGVSRLALVREEARHQIAQLEAEADTLDEAELTRRRAAIKRRLLSAEDDRQTGVRIGLPGLAAGLVLALGLGALGYFQTGSPGLPGKTAQADQAPSDPQVPKLLTELESLLQEQPQRLDGWLLLGRNAKALGQWRRAARAYGRAAALEPDNAEHWVDYGEMLVELTEGRVTPAALMVFDRAKQVDPQHPIPDYFRGLSLIQKGRQEAGLALWRQLAEAQPAGSPMRQYLTQVIAQTEEQAARRQAQEQIAALPAEEQQAMIRSMVEGLAARLEEDPDDPQGWLRLANAYEVLGRSEEAIAAYERVLPMLGERDRGAVRDRLDRLKTGDGSASMN